MEDDQGNLISTYNSPLKAKNHFYQPSPNGKPKIISMRPIGRKASPSKLLRLSPSPPSKDAERVPLVLLTGQGPLIIDEEHHNLRND